MGRDKPSSSSNEDVLRSIGSHAKTTSKKNRFKEYNSLVQNLSRNVDLDHHIRQSRRNAIKYGSTVIFFERKTIANHHSSH